jgi:voltage-gated potassium channel
MSRSGVPVVVIDADAARVDDCPFPTVVADAAQDDVLRRAGIDRASTLVATLGSDAASLFVTLSARALNPGLTIIARSRTEDAEQKFVRAGADRVVNPQHIGGSRVAAFALQPHVVDFLDIAMHDEGVEFRMEEVEIPEGGLLVGSTVRDTRAREGDSALLLALRPSGSGEFITNPRADTVIGAGDVFIAIGTADQLRQMQERARAT